MAHFIETEVHSNGLLPLWP